MLLRKYHRRNELLGVALESSAAQLDQDFMILVEDQAVLRTVDSQFVNQRPHLCRESEIGGHSPLFTDDDPNFIHDFAFAYLLETRAHKPIRDHIGRIAGQKFCNSGDSM